MFTETITIVRQTTDKWGQRTAGSPIIEGGWVLAPRQSVEGTQSQVAIDSRNTVTTGLIGYGPHDSALKASDVIQRADGTKWEVLGEVGRWKSPFTGLKRGCEAAFQRVTG